MLPVCGDGVRLVPVGTRGGRCYLTRVGVGGGCVTLGVTLGGEVIGLRLGLSLGFRLGFRFRLGGRRLLLLLLLLLFALLLLLLVFVREKERG